MTLTDLYLHPIASLVEAWRLKGALSAAVVWALAMAEALFEVRVELVVLVALLVVVDLLTGVAASKRRGERIESRKLRLTIVKVIEYTLFLGSVTAVSNVLGHAGTLPYLSASFAALSEVAFAYVALTELSSVHENLSPQGGPAKALRAALAWFRGRAGDDLPTADPNPSE